MSEKKIKIKVDVETNTDASIAKLKELRKQLKETAVGSADFKKLSADIRDVEDAIEGAKLGADDFAGALEAAPGPVGKLFQAIKKVEIATKSWGAALKATGIGLIVAAVGGLVAAFTQTEGALKKLEPLLIGFEKILGGIFEAFQPVLDAFLEMALKALPYITNGIKVFYSSLFALFTLVKEAGVGVGKILKGVFTLDMKSIEEGWEQLKGGWSKTVDSYNATSERFEAGTKKLTKTEKENLKERDDAAQKALDEKIKRLEAEDKLGEARLTKLKAEALESAKTEQERLDVEKSFAVQFYELRKKDLEDKLALYKKDSVEYKNLQSELINLDAEYINQKIGFTEKENEILQKAADKRKEELDKEIQGRRDFEKFQIDQYEKIKKLEEERMEVTFRTNQAVAQSWIDLGQNISGIFGSLVNVFEQGSDMAKAFGIAQVAINAASSIGQILVNSKAAGFEYDKAIATGNAAILMAIPKLVNPITAPLGIAEAAAGKAAVAGGIAGKVKNKVNTALQIGAVSVSSAAQIAAIISTKKSGSAAQSSGGSNSGGGAQISLPSVAATPAPQIQTGEGINPSQQIGQTISAAQRPIRAYVVSGDISSQQALDRRTNRAATFSAG
jgi:hypothetical protein